MISRICITLACVSLASASSFFSEILPDQHPCKPEVLKHATRYMCDRTGRVICLDGWTEPEFQSHLTDLNPCLEPVCNVNNKGCIHGECRAPNVCACEVGWDGPNCDQCLSLPGCVNGYCKKAYDCICKEGWTGALCERAQCDKCNNGYCASPNQCKCHNGWSGDNCDVCEKMPGCHRGFCDKYPYTCKCEEGWQGPLCDQPKCDEDCHHGVCIHNEVSGTNLCICDRGWQGKDCNQCVPYWECPSDAPESCSLPNECMCPPGTSDPKGLCGNHHLYKRGHHNGNIDGQGFELGAIESGAPVLIQLSSDN